MSLLAASLAMKGLSIGTNLLAQKRLKDQAADTLNKLKGIKQNYMSDYGDVLSAAEDSPKLNIDRSLFDAMEEFARNESIAREGRAFGDEQMRDTVRQSSSDALGRAMNVAGSGADALAAVSEVSAREMDALNKVDVQSLQNRYSAIQESKNRLLDATRDKAVFNQRADLMEFNANRQREQYINELKLGRAEAMKDFGFLEAGQEGALASAGAEMLGGVGDMLSGVGTGLLDAYMNEADNEFLSKLYGLNGGESSGSSLGTGNVTGVKNMFDDINFDVFEDQIGGAASGQTDISSYLPDNDFWKIN